MAKKATKAPKTAKGKGAKAALPADRENMPAVARVAGGRFAPGVSGNPGGRPRALAEVKALAAEHTADAIKALHEVAMRGSFEPARVAAAVALLDRAWGKPTQAVEMSGPDGGAVPVAVAPLELGPEQMAQLLHVLHEAGQLGMQPSEGDGT